MTVTIFKDRKQAGELLAEEVARHGYADPVVFGLPRGGVPVAAEVAAKLKAPLDVILVRKIGAPTQPELAIGAVVDGATPEIVRNEELIRELGIPDEVVREEAQRQLEIIEARRKLWVAGRERVPVKGRTAIIVDDGIATGATVRASLHALKRQGSKRTVVATPVAPMQAVEALRQEADDVVCLEAPEYFGAIGFFYLDFSQVSDAEVSRLLDSLSPAGNRKGG
ncbi:MAG TPA: phosphoribosyltransferase family protein [Hyphomicrobium sp.]|nr:phosphoribosyltransferase family protein [Hyphomicrobium sp.]